MSGSSPQQIRRGKCSKKFTVKGHSGDRYIIKSQWDGCNQFVVAMASDQNDANEMTQTPKGNCMACGCHWSFHEKNPEEQNPETDYSVHSNIQERYTECCKNQILKQFYANETHMNDGCKEFVPGGFDLICDGCNCHRSFHNREQQ